MKAYIIKEKSVGTSDKEILDLFNNKDLKYYTDKNKAEQDLALLKKFLDSSQHTNIEYEIIECSLPE